jgi:hypothetical protein
MSKNVIAYDALALMAEWVDPRDWCAGCGYMFGYIEEGCDECANITGVLEAVGKTFPTEEG